MQYGTARSRPTSPLPAVLAATAGLLVAAAVATGTVGDGRFAWPFLLGHLVLGPVAGALAYRWLRPSASLAALAALAGWGALAAGCSFVVVSALASVVPWDPWLPAPLVVFDVALFAGLVGVLVAAAALSTRLQRPWSILALAAVPVVQALVVLLLLVAV